MAGRWDQECNYNRFNQDGSPIPFTKQEQALAYRIWRLEGGHEGKHGQESIDVMADLIETRADCHFDPRGYGWIHYPERLKQWMKELDSDIWCLSCRKKWNRCACESPNCARGTMAMEYWEKKIAPEDIKPWAEHLSASWTANNLGVLFIARGIVDE